MAQRAGQDVGIGHIPPQEPVLCHDGKKKKSALRSGNSPKAHRKYIQHHCNGKRGKGQWEMKA